MSTARDFRDETIQDFLAMLIHEDIKFRDRCAYRSDLTGQPVEVTKEVHTKYRQIIGEEEYLARQAEAGVNHFDD